MIITYATILHMLNEKELTVEKINVDIDKHIDDICKEFRDGFKFIEKYPKSVTIFGSSRLTDASSHYGDAKRLAERIVKDLDYTVITGGGPGIMAAANLGARDVGGRSIGLNINIPNEQHRNPYITESITFDYFFTRKTILNFAAEAYVFFPGGFGTLDELFGILTLIQTKKIPAVPIILFGKDFWNPFKDFLTETVLHQHHTIEDKDLDLFVITNSIDSVLKIVKGAPVSEWWKMMD
ncbi:MAG: TIGR00730 family Rossman fold protein [Candidatus Taylorbacteria bacterium]|nr:TIGR00730 family Rossman fold protein [Candidatus Taylorbacteria bacterium]